MKSEKHDLPNLSHSKSIEAKPVSFTQVKLIEQYHLDASKTLPFVIEPTLDNLSLVKWAGNNQALIEEKLLQYGAILFRNFDFQSSVTEDFEKFALILSQDLISDNGEHPRQSISGRVYTPVFYPQEKKIIWHNENSFNQIAPKTILFCCVLPSAKGGETPIVDSRKVFDRISPEIRRKFEEKQIMYVRNYINGLGLTWQQVFRTENRFKVEKYCEDNSISYQWKGKNLRTSCIRPAVIRHPQTGETSWFNQAQHWHLFFLDSKTRDALMYSFAEEDLPRTCYYGDGSAIEDEVMAEINQVYQDLEVVFPWQKGDVLVLDNILAAHARNPYEGQRKLLISMGNSFRVE